MSETNERSVASDGSVAERPLGDPEVALEILRLRVAELEQAIRRLAEQDATLSLLCKRDGSQVVTVTMDATPIDFLEQKNDQSNRIAALEDQIARLRGDAEVARLRLEAVQAKPCPYVTGKTTRYCTLTPFTITDEERGAVERAAGWLDRWQATHGYHSAEGGDLATLSGLLERMGGGR